MSRRNSREAKRARREEKMRRLFEREQITAKANEDFEESLRKKVRAISEEYNSKLRRSSVPELRAEYAKRKVADPSLPPSSKFKKDRLISELELTPEYEKALVERRMALR